MWVVAMIYHGASLEGEDKCGSRKVGSDEFRSIEGGDDLESIQKKKIFI